MARPSISPCRPRPSTLPAGLEPVCRDTAARNDARRSEHRLADHSFVRHLAVERGKALEILARQPARGRAQCRIEIVGAVELHLREQKGLARSDWERICPGGGPMQDQGTDMGELPKQRGVPGLVISVKCVRLGARAAIPDEIRHHAVLTPRRAPATLTHGRNTTRAFFAPKPLNPAAFRPAFIPPRARPTTPHSPPP